MRLVTPNMRLQKHLQAGNPAMFCFSGTNNLQHDSQLLGFEGNKKPPVGQAALEALNNYRCCAQEPEPLLRQFCCSM
jgi:hypothetical protein